jgi:hypothetical protein
LKELPPPIPYQLILYADGQMFLFRDGHKLFFGDLADSYIQILTKKLDKKEICALLNTVDKTGFFAYDPSTYDYSKNNQEGLVTEYIQVNSWHSKAVALYGLGFTIEEEFVQYEVDKVMLDTYNILNHYPSDKFEIYQPEKLAIWAEALPNWNGEVYAEWPIQSPSLAEISQLQDYYHNPGKSTVLEDNAARVVYDTFQQSIVEWGLPFSEDGISYYVLAIPLLPYQSAPSEGEFYAQIPSPEFSAPQFTLSCEESDGVVEIPVP